MTHIPGHNTIEPTPEQLEARLTEASGITPESALAGGQALRNGQIPTPTSGAPVVPPVIASADLTPAPELTIAPPAETTPTDIESIPLAEIETPEVKEPTGGLSARLEDATRQLEGFDDQVSPELATATRQLTDINLRIERQKIKGLRAEEEALKQGRTLGFARGEAAVVRREAAFEALELSAIASAAQGRFRLAKDLADDANKERFEALEKEAATARANILENFDTFTAAEKKRATAALARLDADDAFLKEQRVALKEKSDTVFDEVEARGIVDTDIIEDALAQDDRIGALRVINERAPIQPSELEQLKIQKEQLNIEKLERDIDAIENEGQGLGISNASFGTPEYVLGQIQSSAKFGDQRLTDSRLEKLDQAALALGGVESLNAMLFKGDDGIDLTGPVKGRVRSLTTALGGDAEAAAINATIQGLVPTVARGIFGEVGVLTDADINNYKKTLANLAATEDQNRLVSVIMLDVLSRSYENTLLNSASNQTNVSGFADSYINIRNRIDTEKLKLGVTAFSSLSNEDFLDSAPDTTSDTASTPDFQTTFNSFIGGQPTFPQL